MLLLKGLLQLVLLLVAVLALALLMLLPRSDESLKPQQRQPSSSSWLLTALSCSGPAASAMLWMCCMSSPQKG
jgi:hypothetical protein